jgi:alpha-beta hydrolase superfamily lysophospholipase
MKSLEFNWQTKADLNIYAKEWVPANPKAVICLVHGLGEHVNRYEHFAKYFGQHGFVTIGNDHHGHGKSGGKRGHTPDYESLMEEISQLVVKATERHSGLPIFLYGHSMGGNLVMNYVLSRNPKIAGMVATGPVIQVPEAAQPSAGLMMMAKVMNKIFPSLQQPNGLDANNISSNPAEVEKYLADPLVHDKISMRLALVLLEKAAFLDKYTGEMPIPTLLMHGEKDNITSPQGTIDFAKRVGGEMTFKLWNDMVHEIHNEPKQMEVFKFVLEWMKKTLSNRT